MAKLGATSRIATISGTSTCSPTWRHWIQYNQGVFAAKKNSIERRVLPSLSTRKDEDSETGVITATQRQTRLKRPRLYKVLLHNDDYTPRSFVVMLLTNIFGKSESDASSIMLKAHNTGISVAGVYPFSIAETKVGEVLTAADKAGFPLLCTMEPEHDGEEGDDGDAN